MNKWDDTWGQISWYSTYYGNIPRDSDEKIIWKIKNYYNAGVDFNMANRNEEGMTPLHYAAKYSSVNIVKMLIDGGADVRITDKQGRTPLHYAAEVGNLDMVQYLIEHGPKDYEKVKDRDGKTADQYAALNGEESVVQFFEDLAHPEVARERKEREKREKEAKEKRRLNTFVIGLCIVGALSLGGYATTKILKKADKDEKSKVELKAENTQKDVKQKAVEDKKPEPVIIEMSNPSKQRTDFGRYVIERRGSFER